MKAVDRAIEVFRQHHGILTTGQALKLGIHPATLYSMRDNGLIEALSRGVYRLADLPLPEDNDLLTVALAIPKGVICLLSALSFHQLTTQIPRQIDVACKRETTRPVLKYPPVRVFWYAPSSFEEGIESHLVDGVSVRIYSAARTIADCFKFRNVIGLDVALEALKLYWREHKGNVSSLMRYAQICRVTEVIRPYLESLIHE